MNITYLFGAGASKGAIPINEQLIPSMELNLQTLKEYFKLHQHEVYNETISPFLNERFGNYFFNDYESIVEEGKKHQSIDTFAKKLYIKNDYKTLKRLKTILSIYFIIIQADKNADVRYDSFFASILEETTQSFPKDLKIISWNYDFQFEKAYSEYSNDYRIDACKTSLNIYSKNTGLDNVSENFGILKLNGTAAFLFDTEKQRAYNFLEKVNENFGLSLIQNLLTTYSILNYSSESKDKTITTLSFAWEDYSNGKNIVNKAIDFTNKTEILIVVGYSFPFFNRKVDRDIISAMKNLKKVYFQAPDAADLRERFLAIRDDIEIKNLLLRTDVKQFVIPNEF